jgi:hypothetical protein
LFLAGKYVVKGFRIKEKRIRAKRTNRFCNDMVLVKAMQAKIIRSLWLMVTLLFVLTELPQTLWAQEEAASAIRRYKEREYSTGYYEEYEAKPLIGERPLVGIPGVSRGIFPYSPTAASVRIRARLADSHRGIKFYKNLKCDYCHRREAEDIHTVRAHITCRQCHGGEPIATIDYYYSPLNPIRRHAYVCSKCHEGASASFASYMIHAPNPAEISTLRTFPVFFIAYWGMIAILAGTFLFFLPHTIAWGIREIFMRKGKKEK